MTDTRDALMRAILVDPADDTVRRAYADHCRENGDDASADFIEVQIQAARCEVCHGKRTFHYGDYLCHNCQPYYDRERELWTTVQSQFVSPSWQVLIKNNRFGTVPEELVGTVAIVSRGFVSAVRTTLAHWVGGACERFGGDGDLYYAEPGADEDDPCPACNATGSTPAHGPRIVAEQPVEEVIITDAGESNVLYKEGRDWLVELPWDDVRDHYETESAAQSALSRALVNWARREAWLPPMEDRM